ncbi:MAG: UDP-N-acetylmuramoyl-tripeptide--D-alanyl-D-alanine ligase [Cytophagales bacterium]|nr:UDP-N-acetylmuramoyl-tripeptide--D-alanyl-D-alanine ligase [Bernardetiaceae bacterium]MDW8204228.1 UDP-N-acetylmuramoyl-tripeptide--D-alanyl-D-alanine ligase [Cytophagales bacterium]
MQKTIVTLEQLYARYREYPIVSTDSRQLPNGCIFFALKGAHFNGNHFAAQALQQGAAYAVVDDPSVAVSERFLLVEDALQSLQQLAQHHRRQLQIPFIAITGTNGKTTTKELVAAVLRQKYRTHATQGNLNNHIGVPLTLLQIRPEIEIAVIEMGANRIGDIAELCRIAEPDFGLITNIGQAHLEGFGSFEGVIRAKSELLEHLEKNKGQAFINARNPLLAELGKKFPRPIYYGLPDTCAHAELVANKPFISYQDSEGKLHNTQLIGAYNFDNILSAIAIGTYFRVPAAAIHQAIAAYVPANNRSQVHKTEHNTLIMDAYNANPSSMQAALDSFAQIPAPCKIAILGDMLELGSYSAVKHREIAEKAMQSGFEKVLLCGKAFYNSQQPDDTALYFSNKEQLAEWLQAHPLRNCFILLKGSRGVGLETIATLL